MVHVLHGECEGRQPPAGVMFGFSSLSTCALSSLRLKGHRGLGTS